MFKDGSLLISVQEVSSGAEFLRPTLLRLESGNLFEVETQYMLMAMDTNLPEPCTNLRTCYNVKFTRETIIQNYISRNVRESLLHHSRILKGVLGEFVPILEDYAATNDSEEQQSTSRCAALDGIWSIYDVRRN